jgi:hypothetical protein
MICQRCRGIPLDIFLQNRSIQYELHRHLKDFVLSAKCGCHSCQLLLQQRESQLGPPGFGPPHLDPHRDGDSYWIEWDNLENRIVLASGWNHYFLDYDSETGLRTTGKAVFFHISFVNAKI